ncbi:MAG: sarcosine oxidase subunit gamma [Albidovulum sp.]
MPDHQLKPLCAMGDYTPRVDQLNGLTIRENPDLAMASVSARMGRADDAAKAMKKLGKFNLPGPSEMAGAGPWSAFWTGPDQWMVTAPFASHEDIVGTLKPAFADAASVTEQTDGWVRFEVEGTRVLQVFERLCALDIHAMTAGQASRTVIEHLGCFVLCHAAGQAFSVLTMRSAAASLHHALTTA